MRLDGLLTPKDISYELDVSYVTVINYLNKGIIRGFKVGGQWKINPKEFERFKKEGNWKQEAKQ